MVEAPLFMAAEPGKHPTPTGRKTSIPSTKWNPTEPRKGTHAGDTARPHLANTVLDEKSTSENNAGDRVVRYQL